MFKKLSLISLFTLLPASYYFAQTTAFGYLKDDAGKPVEQAVVDLKGEGHNVTADKIGYFQFVNLKPGHYQIVITKPNLATKVFDFDVASEKKKDLGTITLYSALSGADQGLVILDSNSDDNDNSSQGATVGLLQSSQDVFSRIASFDLGAYWFRPRGIDSRTGEFMLNGVAMADADNGNVDFSTWGGLNEITRYPEISSNHAPSEYAFGGASSVVYKNTLASEYRKGSQLTYSLTNRNYRNRLSYRYSSGMSKSGWAFTGMLARRWAQEGIQEGTFYDAISGYIGIEKKISDNNTLAFNVIGADYRRSTSSPNTQEVYDFRGVHYNSYWGWQDGRKRSERVRRGFQPIFQLSDYWKINNNSQLWATVSYQFGKNKGSRLDWYRANNPSPTYYRNLPSYWLNLTNPAVSQSENIDVTRGWWTNNDQDHTQINWNNLYYQNMNNAPYMSEFGGRRALYDLVDDVKDDKVWDGSTHYTYNFNDNTRFILNLTYQNYYSEQYREVKDLLGADFALNMDAFANNTAGNKFYGKFNTLESDSEVAKRVGDKIGYDYIFRRQEVKVNPALKFSTGNFDVLVSGLFGYTTSNREGKFKHYLYESSYGKGEDKNFFNVGIKGQVTYRLDGRNFLVYNGAYFTQSPFINDIFFNARVSGVATPNIKNTIIDANDLSYVLNTPIVKLRLTGYLVNTQNETNVQRYFANGIKLTSLSETGEQTQQDGAFITQVLSNVNKRNMGAELGVQVKLTPTLTASGAASYGQYTYTNNPDIILSSDAIGIFRSVDANGNIVSRSYTDLGKATLNNYRQGGTPQQGYSVGLRYSSPKFWWLGANWNYLGDSFLDPSPAIRTDRFYTNIVSGTPYDEVNEAELARVLTPTKLPDAFFFNVNAGKSWLFGRGKYYVMLSASVNNILDNKKYITGGFEQTRNINYDDYVADYDSGHMVFAPKYWYTQGRSYFINLQFRF